MNDRRKNYDNEHRPDQIRSVGSEQLFAKPTPQEKAHKDRSFLQNMGTADRRDSVRPSRVRLPNSYPERETAGDVRAFCDCAFPLDQRSASELRDLNAFNLRTRADRDFKSKAGHGHSRRSGHLAERFRVRACERSG